MSTREEKDEELEAEARAEWSDGLLMELIKIRETLERIEKKLGEVK